jgi:hypothetical protein
MHVDGSDHGALAGLIVVVLDGAPERHAYPTTRIGQGRLHAVPPSGDRRRARLVVLCDLTGGPGRALHAEADEVAEMVRLQHSGRWPRAAPAWEGGECRRWVGRRGQRQRPARWRKGRIWRRRRSPPPAEILKRLLIR